MYLFVDLVIVTSLSFLARNGFRRGFLVMLIDAIGFTVAVVAAILLRDEVSSFLKSVGASSTWSNVGGFALIFIPLIFAVAYFGAKTHRFSRLAGINLANRFAGAGLGGVFGALVVTAAVIGAAIAPIPDFVSSVLGKSPSAQFILGVTTPGVEAAVGATNLHGNDFLLELRQSMRFSQSEVDEDIYESAPLRFPAFADPTLDTEAEDKLVELLNNERVANKLKPLWVSGDLRQLSRTHSGDMYRAGHFAHVSPDGTTPAQRLLRSEISFATSGENLAIASTAQRAHDGLMRSPGHRDNILHESFTSVGIGAYRGPTGLVITQTFCEGCADRASTNGATG